MASLFPTTGRKKANSAVCTIPPPSLQNTSFWVLFRSCGGGLSDLLPVQLSKLANYAYASANSPLGAPSIKHNSIRQRKNVVTRKRWRIWENGKYARNDLTNTLLKYCIRVLNHLYYGCLRQLKNGPVVEGCNARLPDQGKLFALPICARWDFRLPQRHDLKNY
jgi:hypothetical protein